MIAQDTMSGGTIQAHVQSTGSPDLVKAEVAQRVQTVDVRSHRAPFLCPMSGNVNSSPTHASGLFKQPIFPKHHSQGYTPGAFRFSGVIENSRGISVDRERYCTSQQLRVPSIVESL